MPALSIIIPTRNEASHIVSLLTPLQIFRQAGVEIILVDAYSTDATVILATPLVDSIIISVKGRAVQQNKGAALAKGKYLLFLHADTILPPQFIDEIKLCDQLHKNHWGRFDVKLSGRRIGFRIIELMMNLRSRLSGIATGDQAIFVQKKSFTDIGGFASLQLMEDIDLCSRLKKLSKPYCSKLKVVTSSRRWEKNGLIKTIVTMWWYRLQFFFGVDTHRLEKQYYG